MISWRVVVSLAACGAALGAAFFYRLGGDGPAPGVPTVRVEETSFVREISAEGYLRAAESTPISVPPQVTRPLQVAWLVADGARVKSGDVVVRFDAAAIETELREGNADSAAAASKIAKERVQASASRGARRRSAELARSEMGVAEEFELKDTDLFSRHEIIESHIDRGLAAAKLNHADDVKEIERRVSGGKIDVLGVEKRRADMKVARAERALSSLEIKAPHDGIVVLSRFRGQKVRVGDTVWRGHKIAEIPLVEEMEAEIHVLEADAGGLAEGQEADVVVEAEQDRSYAASVASVEALAKPQFQNVPIQYFTVKLALKQTDTEVMKVGQRVRAKIVVEGGDALVVPRQSVFEREGEMVVFRRRGGEFEPVLVELGASSPGRVVVTRGVEAGDEIALRDPQGRGKKSESEKSDDESGEQPGVPGAP